LRSLYQDFVSESPKLSGYPRPQTNDKRVLAAAASLIELLAERSKQIPPAWAAEIGALQEPMYLVPSAKTMKHLRVLCEKESRHHCISEVFTRHQTFWNLLNVFW